MTKFELFSLLSLGYLVFVVLFIRIGFFLGFSVDNSSLLLSFLLYSTMIGFIFSVIKIPKLGIQQRFLSLLFFAGTSIFLYVLSFVFAQTYDLSWDGQGYHQTAIIALSEGWNPVYQPAITLKQNLESQIFAEGYPSALWEIQSTIYSAVGKINAAKILNLAVAIISFGFLYSLLRTISLGKLLSFIISLLIIVQPVYILQLLTYMQDGFGYQLLLIAASSLLLTIVKPKTGWPIIAFILAELFLASTKYSHLPLALLLACIFALLFLNKYLNKEFILSKKTLLLFTIISFVTITFAYLPYVRNQIEHSSPFYPTNIPNIMGAVAYNNIPLNLSQKDKISLLFYGIFSSSQSRLGGDPLNKENIASLKIPFTFTIEEIIESGGIFNNRVGAGGPLYSGIVAISVIFLLVMSFRANSQKERYIIYSIYFVIGLILFLALLTPTPNLLRYVNQLQLLPFAVIIPFFAVFKQKYIKLVGAIILLLISINVSLYTYSVALNNLTTNNKINAQFDEMKRSGNTYYVKAQQFYSNYILLKENNVPFYIVNKLNCEEKVKDIVSSSNTTHFCLY